MYAWSGPSKELKFEVPVKRDSDRVFRLGLVAAMEEMFLRDAEIIVDGQALPFDIDFDGVAQGFVCRIPARPTSGATEVIVKLVRTLTPSDKGAGGDERPLGLEITGDKVFGP